MASTTEIVGLTITHGAALMSAGGGGHSEFMGILTVNG